MRLTQRALDAGESARFSSRFFASAFFSSDGVPLLPPAGNASRWAVALQNDLKAYDFVRFSRQI